MADPRFLESLYPGWGQSFKIDEVLFEQKTDHQHLIIFRNPEWGTVMALDGVVQTTERDEFIYHEMMTHVPLVAHGQARDVLIIGGGDGGILREVLKHSTVERVVQVEIDAAVIDMCKTHLPNHSNGAFDHPKAQIVIADGIEYVGETSRSFDVIISDSTDPIGPGEVLFTSKFYTGIQRCLKPGGVFVAQNGVSFMQTDEVRTTARRLGPLFADQSFYAAAVPTYVGGIMTFAWASDNPALRKLDAQTVEARIAAAGLRTRYYNHGIHTAAFNLPQYVLDAIA